MVRLKTVTLTFESDFTDEDALVPAGFTYSGVFNNDETAVGFIGALSENELRAPFDIQVHTSVLNGMTSMLVEPVLYNKLAAALNHRLKALGLPARFQEVS